MRQAVILLTNNALGGRGGSENYLRDVALALLRRGHRPIAFSLVLGRVADELRRATVPVIDDLARLATPPDVIHGHHHVETLIAALAFPQVPIVHFCHGWMPWEELPLKHPSVRRYVAVDEVCVDRLVREEGIPAERVDLMLNFVDLERFRPRPPLPPRPGRALVMSNHATAEGYAQTIRVAGARLGMTVDIIGNAQGNQTDTPESVLAGYDLVFAKGRSALEALAVGCAVVLADAAGCGPLVTPDNFSRLRARNFGIRELSHAHDPAWYDAQIAAYDARAAAELSARVRAEAGLEPAIDRLISVYETAQASSAIGAPSIAAANHLCRIARELKRAPELSVRIEALTRESEASQAARGRQIQELERRLRDEEHALAAARHALAVAREDRRNLQIAFDAVQALPSSRLRNALSRVPMVGQALRVGVRSVARFLD
jgi:glycosyltransferase involved in cell wall biosynthesis